MGEKQRAGVDIQRYAFFRFMLPEEEIQKQQEFLNRCLSGTPRGRIIGQEYNFYLLNIGQHQVVVQYVCYHVGFPRRPFWL